jgi:hypothetical protein
MSAQRIWTLHRQLLGQNGSIISTPLMHFSNKEQAEKAGREADEAFKVFFSGVLVVNGKPVMQAMGLVAQLCLQGIGHSVSGGDEGAPIHEAALLTPGMSNGPAPKIFIPGVQ